MKISASKNQDFAPVGFTITCEDQRELDFFASLFNHAALDNSAEVFPISNHGQFADKLSDLSDSLVKLGGDQSLTGSLKLRTV